MLYPSFEEKGEESMIKPRRTQKHLLLMVIAILTLTLTTVSSSMANELSIRYLNLQAIQQAADMAYAGDSILISTPQGKHVLIDSGTAEAGPQVLSRLQELGITHLDYVFATHPHQDHIGGFRTVLAEMSVGQFYQIDITYDSGQYRTLQRLLAEKDISHTTLEEGNILEIEEGIVLEFFNPPAGTSLGPDHGLSTGGINDLSMVFRLTYQDFSALFTGDIYRAQEEKLVAKYGDRLQSRFYDAPHHGQDSSSSKMFINQVKPEISVFSIQFLASFSTYQALRELNSKVYVTGLNGEVLLTTDGQGIAVDVEQEINSPFLR